MEENKPQELDELYDSIYMDVVRLVEKDNIQCEYYLETTKKLKEKYLIEIRSDELKKPKEASIKPVVEDAEKIKEEGEITYKVMLRQSSTMRDGKGNVIIPESDLLEWFSKGLHLHKYTSWDTM